MIRFQISASVLIRTARAVGVTSFPFPRPMPTIRRSAVGTKPGGPISEMPSSMSHSGKLRPEGGCCARTRQKARTARALRAIESPNVGRRKCAAVAHCASLSDRPTRVCRKLRSDGDRIALHVCQRCRTGSKSPTWRPSGVDRDHMPKALWRSNDVVSNWRPNSRARRHEPSNAGIIGPEGDATPLIADPRPYHRSA
jgi:hypothetical protein